MSRAEIEHGLPFGVMFHADDDARLMLFAVQRTRQRQGIGSALLHGSRTPRARPTS